MPKFRVCGLLLQFVDLFHSLMLQESDEVNFSFLSGGGGGRTPILGDIWDVQPEGVTFPGRKPADGCKFFTKNLRMGHNFDIILPWEWVASL